MNSKHEQLGSLLQRLALHPEHAQAALRALAEFNDWGLHAHRRSDHGTRASRGLPVRARIAPLPAPVPRRLALIETVYLRKLVREDGFQRFGAEDALCPPRELLA